MSRAKFDPDIPLEEVCAHEWVFRPDWGGDPDIPNGTFDASTYYCPLCDTETDERPDDYEEPFEEPYEDILERYNEEP